MGTSNWDKPWAYSGLDTYETCAWSFYNKYETKNFPYVETPAMAAGKRVHQHFDFRIKNHRELPSELAIYEPWIARWEALGSMYSELKVSMDKSLQITGYFDKNVWHRGAIDVAVVKAESAAIFDWKTGNSAWEKPLQNKIYALDLMVQFPYVNKVTAANIWLKTAALGTVQTFTRQDHFSSIAADIYTRVGRIEQSRRDNHWPAMPNALCRAHCDVVTCQHNGKGVR